MDDNQVLVFQDSTVTYDQFTTDLAAKLAVKIYQIKKGEMEVSKAQAYRMYGRADVDRWIKKGLIEPSRISPGKTRYKLFELQKLASVKQNYLL
ncbi:MAG: hypothetical protein EOM31_10965 [Bacteroidia bacterium]|nr:hypothetical protein [Bacteroidia bacterium]